MIILTDTVERILSWEANRILWNPKVHYRIHKYPPSVSILSQLDPFHNLTSNFLKIHLNIILPSTSGSPRCSLSFKFPPLKPCIRLSSSLYVPHAPSIIFLEIMIIKIVIVKQFALNRFGLTIFFALNMRDGTVSTETTSRDGRSGVWTAVPTKGLANVQSVRAATHSAATYLIFLVAIRISNQN